MREFRTSGSVGAAGGNARGDPTMSDVVVNSGIAAGQLICVSRAAVDPAAP